MVFPKRPRFGADALIVLLADLTLPSGLAPRDLAPARGGTAQTLKVGSRCRREKAKPVERGFLDALLGDSIQSAPRPWGHPGAGTLGKEARRREHALDERLSPTDRRSSEEWLSHISPSAQKD
jgi:hypothetical protein